MSLLILFTILLLALIWGTIFSKQFKAEIKEGFRTLRITIITDSGDVIYDNHSNSVKLDNHKNRPEISTALQHGIGESERFSNTLRETTYYYAMRLDNGNILRLSLTTNSIYALFYDFVPIVIISLLVAGLFAFFIAKRLTKKIIAPINSVNLDSLQTENIYDELVPFIKKIEHQKKEISAHLTELEDKANTIQAITENMQEGLLLVDNNETVLLANTSLLNIFEVENAENKDIIHICRDKEVLGNIRQCLSGIKTETTYSKDNKTFSVYCNPVYESNTQSGAVILFVDSTQRYFMETQRKEFSANVSHELKTPLTAISALSEMIVNGTAKENDIKSFAEKINTQSGRLVSIINDIIKLSEFDEGSADKDFSRFNLYDLANTIIGIFSEHTQSRNITIELLSQNNIFLTANMRMIDELLNNLIDNAVKYNKDGGSVTVSLAEEKGECKISVADTGIGIGREHLERIFERFYRVDKSRSKKTGGTGLGLSIVKHVVEFHKGRIDINSHEATGTKITCYFNIVP